MVNHFADRLFAAVKEKGSPLVVGLDPHLSSLPGFLLSERDSLEGIARAIRIFSHEIIDAIAPYAAAIKPQFAFYEMFGSHGVAVLEETIAYARQHGLLVIGDGKRNDIGSTATAYANAYLSNNYPHLHQPKPWVADALTINPYLGSDGVLPFAQYCASGKGIFVLVRTSNPSASDFQDLPVHHEGETSRVVDIVATRVSEWGAASIGSSGYSAVGAVVGATRPTDMAGLRERMPNTPFLIPGLGAQGGSVTDCISAFDSEGLGAVINAARSVIFAFREAGLPERDFARAAAVKARELADEMRTALSRAKRGTW